MAKVQTSNIQNDVYLYGEPVTGTDEEIEGDGNKQPQKIEL